jgi:hypothetical protein
MPDSIDRYTVFFEDADYNKGRPWELRDQRLHRVIAQYETEAEAQRHADTLNLPSFHWRDGWHFRRGPQACVEIVRAGTDRVSGQLIASIPENEWASIVCSVSAKGETAERWTAAREFHGKE